MDVIYFFRESGVVRVPFFKSAPALYHLLLSKGGNWDKNRQEFILKRDFDVCKINVDLHVPFVMIDDSPSASGGLKSLVYNFFERSWNDLSDIQRFPAANHKIDNPMISNFNVCNFTSSPVSDIDQPFSFPVLPSLPEMLSDFWLQKLDIELRSRKYSHQTQKAYIYFNRLICRTLQKTPESIRPVDVTEFLALIEKNRDYSASSMNLAISAIKFFYRYVLKNDDISEQRRPRHDERLPMILSKDEIIKVLGMEKNPKHRLLLMLVYSSGLRVSEVVALKKEHIDLSRKVIFVRQGKGRKDRSTILSDKAAQFIKEYYSFFIIDKWLFPGRKSSRPLSIRSAQHIFDKAIRHAGIAKKISIHGLRHTFATHLLESGTDIRYIQTLLGHSNLRTTERYTHVAKRSVLNIKSPLDSIL